MSETGAVKFSYEHVIAPPVTFAGMDELNACRRKLLQLRMIGLDPNGIGFGNLSVRDGGSDKFYITGTGAGGLATLGPQHFAKVTTFNFAKNWLRCEGPVIASSESLTHAAIYETDASVSAVIHGHSAALWRRLLDVAPTTSANIEYGTPEMAREVMKLFATTDLKKHGLFVMAGHEEGIVAFGKTPQEAFEALLTYTC